jgi:hypothetical protein
MQNASLDVCSTLSRHEDREIICGRRRKWSIYNNNNHKFISAGECAIAPGVPLYISMEDVVFAPAQVPGNGERKRVAQLLQIVDLFWVHIIVGLCWRGRSELFRSTGRGFIK